MSSDPRQPPPHAEALGAAVAPLRLSLGPLDQMMPENEELVLRMQGWRSAFIAASLIGACAIYIERQIGLSEGFRQPRGKPGRVPSTLRFRKFPGKPGGVWCSILFLSSFPRETREFP